MLFNSQVPTSQPDPSRERRLARSETVAEDAYVSEASRFGDPVWEMNSLVSLLGVKASAKLWDFRQVPGYPAGFSLALAEYAYHRLHKPVHTHDRHGSWLTVLNELYALRNFSVFCAELGFCSFSEIDESVFDRYIAFASSCGGVGQSKSKERTSAISIVLYRLWEYGAALSEPLKVLPFGRRLGGFKVRGQELYNKTLVIPESVFGPLTAAALDYVLEYSETILEVYSQVGRLWTDKIDPLPLSSSGKRKRLTTAVRKFLSEVDAPWRKCGWQSLSHLIAELHQLRRACAVVILAFSGIRLSELLSLEENCCVIDVIDGRNRYFINTMLRKHRGVGAKDTWVVIKEVVRAVEILEQLTKELRFASGLKNLLISTATNSPFTISGTKKTCESVFVGDSVTYQCNAFLKKCNAHLDRTPIPGVLNDSGEYVAWRLNARQFRRTLARYIARQPFGTIAGMIQYKHVEVACFEGYAGEDPSWNKLLSEEKILASVDVLEEVAMDLANGTIAGALGEQLKVQFEAEFKGRAEDFTPSQIIKWLRSSEKNLHVGKFNFCFFDEKNAICTNGSVDKRSPIINACNPKLCANACVTSEHAPLWRAQMEQAANMLMNTNCTPLQKMVLQREIEQLSEVVNSISGGRK